MSKNKKRNKEIRHKIQLAENIKNNPDWCFCYELTGNEPDVDFENDTPIGKTEPIDGYPFPDCRNYVLDIYKCKRCGKKITQSIAFA
jgi:hypothetical protein